MLGIVSYKFFTCHFLSLSQLLSGMQKETTANGLLVRRMKLLQAKLLLLKDQGLVEFAISRATHAPPVLRAGETNGDDCLRMFCHLNEIKQQFVTFYYLKLIDVCTKIKNNIYKNAVFGLFIYIYLLVPSEISED